MAREIRRKGSEDHSGNGQSQHGGLPLHEAVRAKGVIVSMTIDAFSLTVKGYGSIYSLQEILPLLFLTLTINDDL
jgi:hypothetical protein